MRSKNYFITLLLSIFVCFQFLSIGNALLVIDSMPYDAIEDMDDIEGIVTVDPFLAPATTDLRNDFIVSTVKAAIVITHQYFLTETWASSPVKQKVLPWSLIDQSSTRLWLKNRALLI